MWHIIIVPGNTASVQGRNIQSKQLPLEPIKSAAPVCESSPGRQTGNAATAARDVQPRTCQRPTLRLARPRSALNGKRSADCCHRFRGTPCPCRPLEQTLQTIYAVQQVWRSPWGGKEEWLREVGKGCTAVAVRRWFGAIHMGLVDEEHQWFYCSDISIEKKRWWNFF